MVERSVEYLIDFAAKVFHYIVVSKVSHDIAFKRALKDIPKASRYVRLKTLYKVSRMMVLDYYLLKEASKYVYGGSEQPARRLARLWLTLKYDYVIEIDPRLESGIERLRKRVLKTLPRSLESLDEILDAVDEPVRKLALKYSFPTWFVEKMVKLLGLHDAERLLDALNEEQWWIRVNTLVTDVDTVIGKLEEKGVVVQRDPDLPYMLRVIDYSEPLHHLEEMWSGEIVFQDKASAMVVEALEPESGDIILDLAAAPGVKDTLIVQLAGGPVRIVAVDVSFKRLKRMLKLVKMYRLTGVEIDVVNADSRSLPLTFNPSKVLLDAPCTSSGAIGKDPAIKIHLEDMNWVSRFPPLQRQMLHIALSLQAPTVYATCSLLPEEGEEQVASFSHLLEEPTIRGSPGYSVYPFSKLVRRYFPYKHMTQGFFIARFTGKPS